MEIFTEFGFEAAHFLPNVPEDHKCRRTHGHSYRVTVHVEGPLGDQSAWVMDFADVSEATEPVRLALDHHLLNDLIDNPTSEAIAVWIWDHLTGSLPGLTQVVVRETPTTGCTYRGPAA
jgi:6-pyruvoyltetrahydropterin/6-carboxytetrahydropterin synthase